MNAKVLYHPNFAQDAVVNPKVRGRNKGVIYLAHARARGNVAPVASSVAAGQPRVPAPGAGRKVIEEWILEVRNHLSRIEGALILDDSWERNAQ